jgi:cytochrome c-type biogenesis protein CcmH
MEPMFLAVAGLMTVGASALVLFGLRRRRRADASRAALNAAVLKQRLGELEREHVQGLMTREEFETARDELQRRALAEAVEGAPLPVAGRARRAPLVTAAFALPLLAVPIYLVAGSPHLLGADDAATAPAGVEAAAADETAAHAVTQPGAIPAQMLAQLETHVASQPADARAWVMLARARMDAGQFAPAATAYQRAIDGASKVAKDPGVWCEYADAVGMSQGGTLAGKPRELIAKALELDAASPCALEMAGSAAIEARDFRAAQAYWQQLLKLLPEGGTQYLQLSTALERIEQQAKFSLPSSSATATPKS